MVISEIDFSHKFSALLPSFNLAQSSSNGEKKLSIDVYSSGLNNDANNYSCI